MKKLTVVLAAVLAVTAFAKNDKDKDKNKGEGHGSAHGQQMKAQHSQSGKHDSSASDLGWKPRQVTSEDKRGIDAYYAAADAAMKANDLQTLSRYVDFPVLMVTDDSRGEGSGDLWNRQQWMQMMGAAMEGMPRDMKISAKRKPFFITNDLAVVEIENRVEGGGRRMSYRSADVLIRRNGKWMTKVSLEGGWGDGPTGAQPGMHPPSTPGTGAGAAVPPGEPKGPATQPPSTTTQQQAPTASTPADPKGTSSGTGDPKGATTSPTGTGKGTSDTAGDPKGAATPSQPATRSHSSSAPDAGTPDAGTPYKGSAKGATTRPTGK